MGDLLSTGDVARLLGMSDARVRKMALDGSLCPELTRIAGGKRVFRRKDVERWVRTRAVRQRATV